MDTMERARETNWERSPKYIDDSAFNVLASALIMLERMI